MIRQTLEKTCDKRAQSSDIFIKCDPLNPNIRSMFFLFDIRDF